MASLKAVAQLEYNVPGCIVSIRIPSVDISKFHAEKTIVDINCKHFFNKLCKATIQPTLQVTTGASTTSINHPNPDGPIFTKPTRITNRYDNIIDQLERKYYGESMVQANQEAEENSDDSEGSDGGEGEVANDMEERAPVSTKLKTKSNKRKVNSDDYDVEDPFIDDEDLIMEVETSLKTHRTKTKHDGFFVSSGKLEVFSPKKAQKTSSQAITKSNPPPAQKKELAVAAPVPEPTEEPPKEGEGSEKKKRKRRTKKEMEEAALAKSAPTSSPSPTDPATTTPSAAEPVEVTRSTVSVTAGEEGVGSPEGAATFVTKNKPEKVLPPWMPDDETLMAMVQFKTTFEASGLKLFKSSHIPKSLEEPLHAVDLVVLQSFSAEYLQKTSGYYEALHKIMGGEVAIGKLRSLLARLRLRDRANAALQSIDDQVEALVRDLKSVLVPCPEKMQPAFKAAKKAQSALAKSGDGENKDKEREKDNTEPRPEEEEGEGAEDAGAALNTSLDLDNGVGSPTAAAAATHGTRYEWFCNWSRPMKVTLCAIEHALKLWVIQENQYREKLTVHDKKYLLEKECVPLVEKDVVAAYFERICAAAMPTSCLQGNISYMRRVTTMLNKVPKEKVAKPVAAVAAASASSAGSAIASQMLPEEEPAPV